MAFIFHLVIPDRSGSSVLLVEEGHDWTLPRVVAAEPWGVVRAVPIEVKDRFGLDIAMLRCVRSDGEGEEADTSEDLWFSENLTAAAARGGVWCDEGTLAEGAIGDPRDRAVAEQWFHEQRVGGPPRLQPWQCAGWYSSAVSWIEETLPWVKSVEQYRNWCGSVLLRIDAGGRRYYLKAAPDYFPDEARATAALALRFPDAIPAPVATDVERGWIVLEDFGDLLVGTMPVERWWGALDTLLALQLGCLGEADELLRSGCRDRRPAVLLSQIQQLADGRRGELPDGYADRVRAAIPTLRALAGELEASPIPNTLVHGDFHADNVVFDDGRYLLFDWSDACVAHPFVDLETFCHTSGPASTDPAIRRRLLEHYLGGWIDRMPLAESVDLFERTEPLIAMHHVISYQEILEALEAGQRWQWESHLPWWLDRALGALA